MPTAQSGRGTTRPKATLTELRARIRALERGWERGQAPHDPVWSDPVAPGIVPPGIMPLGVPAIDSHLPDGGLRLAGLHEIAGLREEWDDAVAAGFCLALLGRLAETGPILWAARRPDLYGPGVAGLMGPDVDSAKTEGAGGVLPGRLILVRARRDAEVLWALEEGLRAPPAQHGGVVLSAVVGEVGEPGDTALRRLQLAAEAAGRPCFVLCRRLFAGGVGTTASATAVALTRWRVGALPSMGPSVGPSAETELAGLPGRPRWRLDLLRCRGAAPGSFTVEWDDATGDFALAAPVCDRPVAREAAARRRAG